MQQIEMAQKRKKTQPAAKKAKKTTQVRKYGDTCSDTKRVIRAVYQKHNTGCAVACAAMLAGVSYKKALEAIHGKKNAPRQKSATIAKMRKGLQQLGVKTRETGRFMQLKQPAIMMFEWPQEPGLHHCIVYDPAFGGRFVDPAGEPWWCQSGSMQDFYLRAWRRSGRMSVAVVPPHERGKARRR